MTNIIGISGISGSGKSTLTIALGKALNATMIFWDDFDGISQAPDDYIEWYHQSKDYNAWQYDALAQVLKQLKSGQKVLCPATHKELMPTSYIIFDAPLGPLHHATGQFIDYSIFLDTPLDIALARRLLRDFPHSTYPNHTSLLQELDWYLTTSRPLYVMDDKNKQKFDVVIDGSLNVETLISFIIKKIKNFLKKNYR